MSYKDAVIPAGTTGTSNPNSQSASGFDVAGADTYNGVGLDIAVVQAGESTFNNVTVILSNGVSNAGGLPLGVKDQYNPANPQLTIRAVQVGSRACTNVTVTVGSVVSIGGGVPEEPPLIRIRG